MAADTGEFFAMHEWNFKVENVKELIDEIDVASDGDDFICDVKRLNWDQYLKNYVCGIRKYVLKDDEKTLKQARRTIKVYDMNALFIFLQNLIFHQFY